MKKTTVIVALFLAIPCMGFSQHSRTNAAHKSGICADIKKNVDLLLYENPYPTTVCSYTDERLLIKPKATLPEKRMRWFVFLAFSFVGVLRNDDYKLPEKVYVGHGTACQMMTTNDAAILQETAKYRGESGVLNAMTMAVNAPKVACPK